MTSLKQTLTAYLIAVDHTRNRVLQRAERIQQETLRRVETGETRGSKTSRRNP